jgi:hypothetical protein
VRPLQADFFAQWRVVRGAAKSGATGFAGTPVIGASCPNALQVWINLRFSHRKNVAPRPFFTQFQYFMLQRIELLGEYLPCGCDIYLTT